MVFHISAFRILGILAVALAVYAKMKKSARSSNTAVAVQPRTLFTDVVHGNL
jgi:hypothetical protein